MSLRAAPRSSERNGAQDREHGGRKGRRVSRGLAAVGLAVLLAGVSACSGGGQDDRASATPSASARITASPSATPTTTTSPSASPSATPSKKPAVTEPVSDHTSWNLQKAVADVRKHHVKSVSYADASELRRSVVHTYNWKVCTQTPSSGVYSTATTLTFKAVEAGESCAHPPHAVPSSKSGGTSGSTSGSGGSSSSGGGSAASGGSTSTGGGSARTQGCSIRSNAGNCYHAGQFCRNADVGATTTDAAGRRIACGYSAGANRWHY